jgi:hypothetical protein
MLALHPVFIGYAGFLWNESNFIAVFLGAFVLQFGSAPSKKRMAAAGLLWGIASLIRQIGFGFALISLFAQWRWDRRTVSVRHVSVFLLGLVIAMAPWVIRNYHHHGRLVLVSTDTMFQLWAGNNDEVFEPYTTDPTPFEKLRGHYSTFGRNDREREIVAYHRALDFIRIEQPQWLFRKVGAGLRRLFVPDNFVLRHMRDGSYGELSTGRRKSLYAGTILGEAVIIVLGIVMLVRARHGPRTAAVLLMVLYALAVHLFTVAVSRHRLVIELVPLGLAGVAWRPWTRRSAALAALCLAVVVVSALT